MLEVLLRGAHEREETRQQVALLLSCSTSEIGWANDNESRKTRFVLDHLTRHDGFRTQVTLAFDAHSNSPFKGNQEFARALAAVFEEDALVLDDPTNPTSEAFHGLLLRSDGKSYRVPLVELSSGGMGIDESPGTWTEWQIDPNA